MLRIVQNKKSAWLNFLTLLFVTVTLYLTALQNRKHYSFKYKETSILVPTAGTIYVFFLNNCYIKQLLYK